MSKRQNLHNRVLMLEADNAKLRGRISKTSERLADLERRILNAHPAGSDEGADPVEVLKTLANDWMAEVMRGPEKRIEFMDGDTPRTIVFEEGDSSVGIPDGYMVDEEVAFSDLVEVLERIKTAAANREHTQGDPCRLLEVQAELRAATKEARAILAKIKGGGK